MKTSYEIAKEQLKGLLKNEIVPVDFSRMVEERVYVIIYQDYMFFLGDPLDGFYYLIEGDDIKPEWYTMPDMDEPDIIVNPNDWRIVINKDIEGDLPLLANIMSQINKFQQKGFAITSFTNHEDNEGMTINFEPFSIPNTMPTLD